MKVLEVQVHKSGGDLVSEPLEQAEQAFRKTLDNNDEDYAAFTLDDIPIAMDQEVEIVWRFVIAKEDEDAEVVRFLYPTQSASITIVDLGNVKRSIRARSLHRLPLEKIVSDTASGTYTYRLDHYFLPHQGFMLCWKKLPSSAPAPRGEALEAASRP